MTDTIDIQHEGTEAKGRYFTPVEGAEREAELTWGARGKVRHATHTFVPKEARGQGIAEKLVQTMIADAKEQGFTISPDCSYVAGYFDKNPELAELRA